MKLKDMLGSLQSRQSKMKLKGMLGSLQSGQSKMKKLKDMLGSLQSGWSKMKKETGSLPQSLPLQKEEATRNPDKPQVYD